MGENTSISWTHHTFNPWWGCVEDGPECDGCYARAWDARFPIDGNTHWGVDAPRRFFKQAHYEAPLRWNEAAAKAGVMRRVFCMSMGDIMEKHRNPDINARMEEKREQLYDTVRVTEHLCWMFLTKRPGNYRHLPADLRPHPRVWLGTTTGNHKWASVRTRHLFKTAASLYWASAEPLLGPIDYTRLLSRQSHDRTKLTYIDALAGKIIDRLTGGVLADDGPRYGLIITGGESQQRGVTRPLVRMDPSWPIQIGRDCAENGVSWHFKQTGALLARELGLKDRIAGAEFKEWPERFQVQQMPAPASGVWAA